MQQEKSKIVKTNNSKFEQPPIRTQFLIFTLLGDYIVKRTGKIWTRDILKMMELLEISERAVRSALSRMTNNGWIQATKIGRRSQYSLTQKGETLLNRGQQRIFEPPYKDWDSKWHLVVYSLPETIREKRHSLRTQLAWLGFGRLAPGTWISPHHPTNELLNTFSDLEIESFVKLFKGVFMGPSSSHDLAYRCWDLKGLEQQYAIFIQRFKSEYDELNLCTKNNLPLDAKEHFIKSFWLTHQFQSFPLKDPNLPISILPPDWIGTTARELFNGYYVLLGTLANQFVDEILSANHDTK